MARVVIIPGQGIGVLPSTRAAQGDPTPVELNAQVDGFLSESHEVRLNKTTYPIESGQSLTDHAVVEPKTLKLEGWVSGLLMLDPGHKNSAEAWDEILKLVESREPVSVVTSLGVYDSMLITSVKAPVDRTTGRALRFDMELEEVLFRDLESGTVPAPVQIGPAEDRPVENNRGRINAPIVTPLSILEEEAAVQTDNPSLWQRLGRAVLVSANPALILSSYFR